MKPLLIRIELDASPGLAALLARLLDALGAEERAMRTKPEPTPIEASAGQPEAETPGPVPGGVTEPETAVPKRGGWITPERDALIERDYPAGRSLDEMHAEMLELPGGDFARVLIGVRAATLGVRRPGRGAAEVPPPPEPMPIPKAAVMAPRPLPARPASGTEPVRVDQEAIRSWASQRGLAPAGARLDIGAINRKRAELGQPPFELTVPDRRRVA